MSLFVYEKQGNYIAVADNNEILVYDGRNEAPTWRATTGVQVIGLTGIAECIISLDVQGKLIYWDTQTGRQRVARRCQGNTMMAVSVNSLGQCAVASLDELVVINRLGIPQRLTLPRVQTTCLAWSSDGTLLAVGCVEGNVYLFAPDNPKVIAWIKLETPIRKLAWNEQGFWLATAAEYVFKLSDKLKEGSNLFFFEGYTPNEIACAVDGSMIALELNPHLMLILAYPTEDVVAQLRYTERTICGLDFGPTDFAGVGLHGGDGNKIDLVNGQLMRTDTHPGRQHQSWLVTVSIHPEARVKV